jgi:hypothetical protein
MSLDGSRWLPARLLLFSAARLYGVLGAARVRQDRPQKAFGHSRRQIPETVLRTGPCLFRQESSQAFECFHAQVVAAVSIGGDRPARQREVAAWEAARR